jgi:putative transposase
MASQEDRFMDKELREQIALFRFAVIGSLVNQKGLSRGEQELHIRQITSRSWEVPGSPRSSIGRSTVLRWLSIYQRSGGNIDSLKPRPRRDRGSSRALDAETEAALLALRREMPAASLPVFLKLARSRSIINAQRIPSKDSLYRLFKRHGLQRDLRLPEDRRRFETELVNDLWQADCMHGPRIIHEQRLRKAFLFAIIDDHSRLITNAQFYLSENLDSFRDCLLHALEKRGLPRKLYTDNGAAFRSHALKYGCARLGVALLHSAAYSPEGKGKIERFFRTLRMQLLPLLPEKLTLDLLNERLTEWLEGEYHKRTHSSTAQSPLERYLDHLSLLRSAPKDLRDYFRLPVLRKVDKDRTVTLFGKLYEAPVGLIGTTVTVLYDQHNPQRVEILRDEQSMGFLTPLDTGVNSRVRRKAKQCTELVPPAKPPDAPGYRSGSLFDKGAAS